MYKHLYESAETHLLWIVVALVVLKQQRASRTEILAACTAAASSCGVFLGGKVAQQGGLLAVCVNNGSQVCLSYLLLVAHF